MNTKSILCREMFGRVCRFLAEHAESLNFSAGTTASVDHLGEIALEIDRYGIEQVAGRGVSMGGTSTRKALAIVLRDQLRDLQLTAASFDREQFPDAAALFRLSRSQSHHVLLHTAGAFLEAMPRYRAAFLACEFPPDFEIRLASLMAEFATATDRQVGGQLRRAGGTHGLVEAVKRGRTLVKKLKAAVRLKLRTADPALYEVWLRASRIKAMPRASDPTESEPAGSLESAVSVMDGIAAAEDGTESTVETEPKDKLSNHQTNPQFQNSMNTTLRTFTFTLGLLAAAGSNLSAEDAAPATPALVPESADVGAATKTIAEAGTTFLGTLDDTQKGKVVYDFKDEAQRKRWSNLPTLAVKRGGLRLGDLTTEQRSAAMALLAAALSPQGYEKVQQIVEGDEVLKATDRPRGGSGARATFGRDEYYISFLGEPSATDPWMIQFGGHHLGINVTLVGGRGTLAPSHTAAQPATYEFEGKTVRPLGREVDKSFALIGALDEAQLKEAVVGAEIQDLVAGPGRDGQTVQPEGIKGAALNEKQRELLLDLASEWTGIQQEAAAKAKLEEMRANLAETWFAWSGPTEPGKAAYFRIQGPTVLIEYAPQRSRSDANNHIHTIYRDPSNDYGKTWWPQ